MKKILAVALALVFCAFVFAACSSGSPSSDASSSASTEASTDSSSSGSDSSSSGSDSSGGGKYTIAVVPKDSTNPWFVRMEEGVKAFQDENPDLTAFQRGPAETDAAQQIQVVEDLIAQGVDALCVVPHDPGAMETVLKKAMDQGIVVITHEASSQQNCDFDLEAFDYDAYGAYIMDSLAKAMGEEGEYICMVGSLTNDSHNQEADAAIARQKEAYPNMTLVDERIDTEDNAEVAYNKAKEALKAHPDLKGFLGTSSFDAPGAGRAIEELGLIGKVYTVGTGMPQTNKTLLEDDAVYALTLWDPADAGYAMCQLANLMLNKEEVGAGTNLDTPGYEDLTLNDKVLTGDAYITITKENVSEYDF